MTEAAGPATWAGVDAYVTSTVVDEDDVLRAALARMDAAGLPPIQVSAAQGAFLRLMAELIGAERALEVGTLGGYSTIWIARGLRGARHVTTLEIDHRHADVARANLAHAGLDDVVDVRLGRAADTLDALRTESARPYDLAFVDADKPSNATYLAAALDLVRSGGLVVVDNVVRRGRLADADDPDAAVRGSRQVVEMAAADPRVSGTVLQTVGAKGYDGLLLLRVA